MTPASRRSHSHPSSTASLPRHLRPSYIFARGPKKLLRGILKFCETKTSNCFRKYEAEASARTGGESRKKKGGSAMPCPQRERRFDKDPGADELPKARTCDGTLFFQLSYTWYGTVCEASKKCWASFFVFVIVTKILVTKILGGSRVTKIFDLGWSCHENLSCPVDLESLTKILGGSCHENFGFAPLQKASAFVSEGELLCCRR